MLGFLIMKNRFINYIENANLFKENSSILLTVSGGKDSMFMLNLFNSIKERYNLRLVVCHYNHSLRNDSDRDELFVKKESEKRNLPFYSKKEDIKNLSLQSKKSIEECARIYRYKFFEEIRKTENLDFIATAHNSNDLSETVLMRIIRGTGVSGLVGILEKNRYIIRPIISFNREEIEEYILQNNIPFVQDETNYLDIYYRNKIRLSLLPILKKDYNERIDEALCRLSKISKDYNNVAKEYISSKEGKLWKFKDNKIFVDLDLLRLESNSLRSILFRELYEKMTSNPDGISYALIEDINKLVFSKTGKYIKVKNLIFKIEYDNMMIFNEKKHNLEENFYFENIDDTLYSTKFFDIIIEQSNFEELINNKSNKDILFINSKFLKDLVIRNRKNGDYMNLKFGKKKLKNIFIDEKIRKEYRDILPVFEIYNEIVWIPKVRRSDTYLAESSEEIVKITLKLKENVWID